jgi:rhodanese-related sulfurtransferase
MPETVSLRLEADVEALKDETPLILDAREPEEYRAGHLQGAINVPPGAFLVST